MCRVLYLPNTARETDHYISASSDNSFPPDYDELFSARQAGYAHLGLEAVNLVKELQKDFGLPYAPAKFWDCVWDTENFYLDKLQEFQNRRQSCEFGNEQVYTSCHNAHT